MKNTLNLSLRQKKLLHIMQGTEGYITGSALARQLSVSPRTIRSDVAEINRTLAPYHAQILSERSKGYLYSVSEPEALEGLTQLDYAFFTTEDRVRYLAFRLCLSDEPLNLYDLEDEMFISHTTLEHDLHQLRIQYVLAEPHIRFLQNRDFFSFEQDEKKRRAILNRLFHEDWNYHTRSNAYYGYHFLDADLLDDIMNELPRHLVRHGIFMEDPSLVSLNLALAIMYHRVTSGHPLPEAALPPRNNPAISLATDELFAALEEKLGCVFAPQEQADIYDRIAAGCLPDIMYAETSGASPVSHSPGRSEHDSNDTPDLNSPVRTEHDDSGAHALNSLPRGEDSGSGAKISSVPTQASRFPALTRELADVYLDKIRETFGIDFSGDDEFYLTLLSYLRYLQIPERIFNNQGNHDIARENLLTEYEIAWLFQDLALQYLGSYVTETELLYLAHCISGALEFLPDTHPEYKLNAVICCHLNMPAAWALKRRVLAAFGKYLTVTAILPVNTKSAYDFSNVDLILSTVRKKITDNPTTDTIRVDPFLTAKDHMALSAHIQNMRVRRLCHISGFSLEELLRGAFWHEKEKPGDRFGVIETLTADFLNEGIIPPEYVQDLLRRESISTFAIRPGLLFMHSLVPASQTRLAIMTFDHRIIWNSHKIRTIILGAFRPQDATLLFCLTHIFNDASLDIDTLKMLKEKEQIIRFFTE